jgi:hypothetical protein
MRKSTCHRVHKKDGTLQCMCRNAKGKVTWAKDSRCPKRK